jgi:hypothetical protein
MRDEDLAGEAKRLIDAIAAKPRFAGSVEESRARAMCAAHLRESGFETRELPFDYSQWPGRFGIPLIAAWMLFAILATAITGATSYAPINPAAVGNSIMVVGLIWGRRRRDSATAQMSAYRTPSANLEAKRGEPRAWLVAHLDSKSQSIPMLARVTSHVSLAVVLIAAIALGFFQVFGWVAAPRWGWIAFAGAIAALPSLFCLVGNKSRGALDNATGVAAVLMAARMVSPEKSFGVLITSGEELDLAGARAWAAGAHPGAQMINCDTVDDEGGWRCMYENRPHALGIAAEKAAKNLGLTLRMGKVIPGIITDSLAFEAAGLPSVTISRGTLRTLARLHTRGDNPERVSGDGAVVAARLLAQMAEELS